MRIELSTRDGPWLSGEAAIAIVVCRADLSYIKRAASRRGPLAAES
jgi:hypothetical protein